MRHRLVVAGLVILPCTAAVAAPPAYVEGTRTLFGANVGCSQFRLADGPSGGDCGWFGVNEPLVLAGQAPMAYAHTFTGRLLLDGSRNVTGRWGVGSSVGIVTLDAVLTAVPADGSAPVRLGSVTRTDMDLTNTSRTIPFTINITDGRTDVTGLTLTMTVRGAHAGGGFVDYSGGSTVDLPVLVEAAG